MDVLRDIKNIVSGKDVSAERRLRKRRAFLRRHPPPGSATSWDRPYSCRKPGGAVTDTNGWRDGLIPPRYGDRETSNAFWQGYNQHLGAKSRRIEDNLYHIGTIGQIMDQPTGSKPCPGGAEFMAPFRDPMNMTKKDLYRFRMWAGEFPVEPWIPEADVGMYGKPLKAWWGGPYGTLPSGYRESRRPDDAPPHLQAREVAVLPVRHPLKEPFKTRMHDPRWWKAIKDGLKQGVVAKPVLIAGEEPQEVMPHIRAVGPNRAYKPGREWETEGVPQLGVAGSAMGTADRSLARKERRKREARLVRLKDGRAAFQVGGKEGKSCQQRKRTRPPPIEPQFMSQSAWFQPGSRPMSAVPSWVPASYGVGTGGGVSVYQEGPGGWQGAYIGSHSGSYNGSYSGSYGGSFGGSLGGSYGGRHGSGYRTRPNGTNQNRKQGSRPSRSPPKKPKESIFPSNLSSSAKPPPIQKGIETPSQSKASNRAKSSARAPRPPRSASLPPKSKKKAPKPRPASPSPSPPLEPKAKTKGKEKEREKTPEPEPSSEEGEAAPESEDDSEYDSDEHPPSCTTCGGDRSDDRSDDSADDDKPSLSTRASSPSQSTKTYAAGHDSECSTCGGDDSDEDEPPLEPTKPKKPKKQNA